MSSVAATTARAARASTWTAGRAAHVIAAIALAALAIGSTWPVWDAIFRYAARNEEQSHSFFAVPIAAWLVWVRRERLHIAELAWSPGGLSAVAIGWVMLVIGFRAGLHAPQDLGAVLVVLGAAYVALGRDVLMRFLPAVGALLLVLPVPGRVRFAIAGPLQEVSAYVAAWGLDLCAAPVTRSGSVLTVNGIDIAVAEACNGMRMVTALAVVAYAFGFSLRLRPAARIGILGVSPLIALCVNVVRLVPTALAHGYSSRSTADMVHEVGGWGALVIALALLFGLIGLLRWLEVPIDALPAHRSTERRHRNNRESFPPVAAAPDSRSHRPGTPRLRPWAPMFTAVVLVSMILIGGFNADPPPGLERYVARIKAAVEAIPYRIGNAVGVDEPPSSGVATVLRPDAVLERRYTDIASGDSFGLTIVHCTDARDLLGHYPPVCYPAGGWIAAGIQHLTLRTGAMPIPACLYAFTRNGPAEQTRVNVVSFFVLPGPPQGPGAVDDMDRVAAASRSTMGTALGVSHIMLAFTGAPRSDSIAAVADRALDSLQPVIHTLLEGASGE